MKSHLIATAILLALGALVAACIAMQELFFLLLGVTLLIFIYFGIYGLVRLARGEV